MFHSLFERKACQLGGESVSGLFFRSINNRQVAEFSRSLFPPLDCGVFCFIMTCLLFLFLGPRFVKNEDSHLHESSYSFIFKLVTSEKFMNKLQRILAIVAESLFQFSHVLWESVLVLFRRKYTLLVEWNVEQRSKPFFREMEISLFSEIRLFPNCITFFADFSVFQCFQRSP